jgi:hypothetical protein
MEKKILTLYIWIGLSWPVLDWFVSTTYTIHGNDRSATNSGTIKYHIAGDGHKNTTPYQRVGIQ